MHRRFSMSLRPFSPISAINPALAFAREHIRSPMALWHPFAATAHDGSRIEGFWMPMEPGVQVLLLSILPSEHEPDFMRVTKPTGIRVLAGSYVEKRDPPRTPTSGQCREVHTSHTVAFSTPGSRYSMRAYDEPCSVLVVRGMPFVPGVPERDRPVTFSALEPNRANALYQKMRRILDA